MRTLFVGPVKELLNIFVESALIPFNAENLVSTLVDDLCGNLLVSTLRLRQATLRYQS